MLQPKFCQSGRRWQVEYGCGNPEEKKNILVPCSIKDHHDNFRENIFTPDTLPDDDSELEDLKERIFEEEYPERIAADVSAKG